MYNDIFTFQKRALLKTSTPLDFSHETSISGFEIGGAEPTDSQRKILFKVDGKLFRFEGNNLLKVDCEETLPDVLANGNSVAELLQVTNVPDWCGKLVYPIVALACPTASTVMPSFKIAAKVKSFNDIFQATELSPVFELGNARILDISFTKNTTGNANATLQVRLRQGDSWTAFMPLDDAKNLLADAAQLRASFTTSTTSGAQSAAIDSATIAYSDAENRAGYLSTLFFKPENFTKDLGTCYLLVNHSALQDCELKAYVAYDDAPIVLEELLGIGTGETQTFALQENIDFDTLQISVDGVNTFNFALDAAQKTLSLAAPEGTEIRASYNFDVAPEDWQEMDLQFTDFDTNFDSGHFVSRFVHRLDSKESSKIAKVKLVAKVLNGTATETFAADNVVALAHRPTQILSCTAKGYWLDETLLRVDSEEDFSVEYDWQGSPLEVFRVAAGFAI